MRDPLKELERFAAQARKETPPATDVAQQVLLRIRKPEVLTDRPLVWFAMASIAAAAVAGVLLASLYTTVSDPLWTLFETAAALTP